VSRFFHKSTVPSSLSLGKAATLNRAIYAEWHLFAPLLSDQASVAPPLRTKRIRVNGVLWVLRTGAAVARHAKSMRQLEFSSSRASLVRSSLRFGTRSTRNRLLLGCRPTRCRPSIRPSCGGTGMRLAQKGEARKVNARPPHHLPVRNAIYCSRKALDQNRQHGPGTEPLRK